MAMPVVKRVVNNTCPACDKKPNYIVQCDVCRSWFHAVCALRLDLKEKDVKKINWHCDECKQAGIIRKCELDDLIKETKKEKEILEKQYETDRDRFNSVIADIKEGLGTENADLQLRQLAAKVADLTVTVDKIGSMMSKNAGGDATWVRPSYADTLKAKKKERKNLLIIESKDSSQAVNAEMQSQLVNALGDIQVIDTRENKNKLIMNFENDDIRNEAVMKMNDWDSIKVTPVKKLDPKITIRDVYGGEDEDNLLDTICVRNSLLNGMKDKMKIIFKKPSRFNVGYFDYLLKCEPEVRKAIHLNDDKICIGFGKYDVVDNYHITVCFHCQKRGHLAKNCPDKSKDKLCPNCAGNHGIKECEVPADQRKCFACDADNKDDVCHMANTRACPKFVAELNKIKMRTDHGF